MGRFVVIVYEEVKYRFEFDSGSLAEAKEIAFETVDPDDLPNSERFEVGSVLSMKWEDVSELEGSDEEI